MIPLPFGLGEHPTIVPVFGSLVNLRSVGPSCRSNATALLPIGFAGFNGWLAFSSIPVPASKIVVENVFDSPPPSPVHTSLPNSGTLIHLTLNALMFANPSACTGNVLRSNVLEAGFKSAHAAAIFGNPALNSGTVGVLSVSPAPNVMFPFEFRKKPFHTHPAVPTGPPNTNSNPPENAPTNPGVPAPLSSSPRNGVF